MPLYCETFVKNQLFFTLHKPRCIIGTITEFITIAGGGVGPSFGERLAGCLKRQAFQLDPRMFTLQVAVVLSIMATLVPLPPCWLLVAGA